MPDISRKIIGERIRKIRGNRPQEWLATATKMNVHSISRIERGEQNLTIDSLIDICSALNCPLSELTKADLSNIDMTPEASLPPGYGDRIKRYRGLRGYNQETLGSLVGVGIQTVYRWENETQQPTPEQRNEIAKALRIHKRILFSNEEDQDPYDIDLVVHFIQSEHEQLLRSIHKITELESELEIAREKIETLIREQFSAIEFDKLHPHERKILDAYRESNLFLKAAILIFATGDESLVDQFENLHPEQKKGLRLLPRYRLDQGSK